MGLHQLYHPEVFQGGKRQHDYFEGWYYKMVSMPDSSNRRDVVAIIPGISLDEQGVRSGFVQVLDSRTSSAWFIPYPDLTASSQELRVDVGDNRFTDDHVTLAISAEGLQLHGEVSINGRTPFPSSLLSPGIIGWYSFIPAM